MKALELPRIASTACAVVRAEESLERKSRSDRRGLRMLRPQRDAARDACAPELPSRQSYAGAAALRRQLGAAACEPL